MSRPEVKFEIDESGRIGYWVTDEGVLLSRDEKQFIIDSFAQLETENAKLRELVGGLRYCAHEAYDMCARVPVGGERPFTCCPLYDFDRKEYRCEKLIRELGIEVDG